MTDQTTTKYIINTFDNIQRAAVMFPFIVGNVRIDAHLRKDGLLLDGSNGVRKASRTVTWRELKADPAENPIFPAARILQEELADCIKVPA